MSSKTYIFFGPLIFVLSMFAITTQTETYIAAAIVAAAAVVLPLPWHISCHIHVHFYVFEQFATNLLYVDPIAFGRCSLVCTVHRIVCHVFQSQNTHTHTSTYKHILCWKKKKIPQFLMHMLSLWMIVGTRKTDQRRAYIYIYACVCLYVRAHILPLIRRRRIYVWYKHGNWIHIWTSFTVSVFVCACVCCLLPFPIWRNEYYFICVSLSLIFLFPVQQSNFR